MRASSISAPPAAAGRIGAVGLDLALRVEAVEPVDDLTTGVGPAGILEKGLTGQRRLGKGRELAANEINIKILRSSTLLRVLISVIFHRYPHQTGSELAGIRPPYIAYGISVSKDILGSASITVSPKRQPRPLIRGRIAVAAGNFGHAGQRHLEGAS